MRIFKLVAVLCLISVQAMAQNIAQQTYDIFEDSCNICHGPNKGFAENFLIEWSAIMQSGAVLPGNPEDSELYKRLLGPTDRGAQMPLNQDPLSVEEIEVIRQWIEAGAPDWNVIDEERSFISQDTVLDEILQHIETLSPIDRPFARYFSLVHLFNAGEQAEILSEYRLALSKLVNSLSWGFLIVNPQPIDEQQLIYYIDLRNYEWQQSNAWVALEEVYPYQIQTHPERLTELKQEMNCEIPMMHTDWFIAHASSPPLYNAILGLPETDRELEQLLEVDVVDNLLNAPGRQVWRAGFNDSGVSSNNRVVERHISRYGAYWKSYDFAASVGKQDVHQHPISFVHDGGEVVFNLPNGLQAYHLFDANGFRLDVAPTDIVSDPAATNPQVRNGLSCIGCHSAGMKEFTDTVRQAILQTPAPLYDRDRALKLYVEQPVMDAIVTQDAQRFKTALEITGNTIEGIEPVSRFHEAFHRPLGVQYAAATLGMTTETLIRQIQENTDLQTIGLTKLIENGTLKRDTWTSNFSAIVFILYPPEVLPPEVLPPDPPEQNTAVYIPDPILRSEISKMLVKPVSDPITVKDMESFHTFPMNLGDATKLKDIKDLTGFEYATNLRALWISGNLISDLSPLASLPNIEDLRVESNLISDLSPLSGLTKLRVLHIRNNPITDFSPLSSLKNLEMIGLGTGSTTTDVSVLSELTALKDVLIWDLAITHMSPMVELPNIETLNLCANNISEIKVSEVLSLQKAPKLKNLYIFENKISDISVLQNLTGLERLNLRGNNIVDVSPLAELTNLKWLDIKDNPINDWTPLYELGKNTNIEPSGFVFASNARRIGIDDTFTFNIVAFSIQNLVGWQCSISFDANILEAIEVFEGNFLSADGTATFYTEGNIDNETGLITGYQVLRLDGTGINGSGTLLSIKFKPKKIGKVTFGHNNCILGDSDGVELPSVNPKLEIEIVEELLPEEEIFTGPKSDVNKDGKTNILDLILVSKNLGQPITKESARSDVNGDGVINILDLTFIANKLDL